MDGEKQTKIDPKIALGNKSLLSEQWDLAIFFQNFQNSPNV